MLAQSDAEKDSAAGVTPPPNSRMPWRVESVEVMSGHKLRVRFIDGLQGVVDMSALVRSEKAGVFATLADPKRFGEAYVEAGVVTWPGELDLAPDAMHAAIKAGGTWVLA
jgi:hypothetical protein